MSIAIGNSLIGGMSNFAYSYLGTVRPKIDKNDDALWSKNEVQSYADAYKKATGVKLDVDKLMETYGNDKGHIDTEGQAKMNKDDALGLSKLYGTTTTGATSSTATSGSATTAAQREAIFSVVNQYTYSMYGDLQPRLDKDSDGRWSTEELQNYADAYKKATGTTLDVDKLMEEYGTDGYINISGQNAMKSDDALGLGNLQKLYDTAVKEAATTTTSNTGPAGDYSIQSLLDNMNSAEKTSFARLYQRYQMEESLLSGFGAFDAGGGFSSLFNISSAMNMYKFQTALYGGNSSSMYSAMSGNIMNFTI